ncbi:MAG: zinc ribbon domain-containing protein, partial [Gemmatimonadales bacterium]
EVYRTVIPYRTNRRSLILDTNEDYDLLLLRLCAGQGGFLRMISPEVQERFQQEAMSPNPDLALVRELADAELQLATEPLAHALGPGPETLYAPPASAQEIFEEPVQESVEIQLDPVRSALPPLPPAPGPRLTPFMRPSDAGEDRVPSDQRCSFCGGRLPESRQANFCPHCGQNQTLSRCPECHSEIELGWKHCITCGHPVSEQ